MADIGNAPILEAMDILSGEQAEVWATVPDPDRLTSNMTLAEVEALPTVDMCMMHVKNIEANVAYDKEQVPILGKRGKGNRKTGETYSGSMTVYMVESVFRRMAEIYKNSGKDFYFPMIIQNHDGNSHAGTQQVVLKGVNFDGMTLAKADADASVLEEDIDFTFEDYSITRTFSKLDGLY